MNFIPLMSPNISEEDIEAAARVLRSGMLVQAENVAALEREVAEYLGVKHVVAASNGTATMHMALVARGLGPGDEVIVPAFSYIATANVVELVGAKPVFVDVEPGTFNIDVSRVERAITPKTKAIIPVHQFGLACRISELTRIAEKHGLFVIEDAACALGAKEKDRFVGTFGQVGSFSLHPRKAVTSGEGGLLTTNDGELAEQFRCLRNHGIKMRDGKMDFVMAGFNYRMTDFQAAVVRGQFARIDEIIARRRELVGIYMEELAGAECLRLPAVPEGEEHTWQTFHVVLCPGASRDALIDELRARGVGTNYGAQCIPYQTYYRGKYGLDCEREFPNALDAFKQGLALPLYEKLRGEEVRFVARTLREVVSND